MRLVILLFVLLTLSVASLKAYSEHIVIISMNATMPQLSEGKARMLFTGRSKSVKDIGRVKLLDLDADHPLRTLFYETLTGQTIAQVNSKWASLAFSGRAVPPDVTEDDSADAISAWLKENPNGLAYTRASEIPEGANVILNIGEGE
ncbi:hypothetical protein [Umboniibacter marinipuniceus]|uniref:Phosphate ABC transporter substrate-binding protein n=1 Tax=Umboniibacter marinipuniceus TaxID=569599 RepID=A0A3M0A7M6_9GAMM|nr:hypothetical protein [Umboniibacter marinipuniceus]RMA80294.1 hypothetical protein DFR27_1660 [Umboniibacter marinipuniceus]